MLLLVITFGSLFFLISGLRGRKTSRNRTSTLEALTGLVGLLYVGLDLYWHGDVTFWKSRAVVIAYYVAWHFVGGVAVAMLVCVIRLLKPKALLIASTALLIVTNILWITRRGSAIPPFCLANGLFSGLLITSLILICFEHPRRQEL